MIWIENPSLMHIKNVFILIWTHGKEDYGMHKYNSWERPYYLKTKGPKVLHINGF
jgi:hypothetical protein